MSKYLTRKTEIPVASDTKAGYEYLYKIIKGDGHCFVNCYLNACSKTYRNLSEDMKTAYSRKLRIDFANFLMSDSTKSEEEISMRLGFLNPNVMCRFLKLSSGESSLTALTEICSIYDGKNEDEIFDLLESANLISSDLFTDNLEIFKDKLNISLEISPVEMTIDVLRALFSIDHRILVSKTDSISETELGVGLYPITLKIYEMVKYVPPSYQIIDDAIKRIISPTIYFEHFESNLFAEYVGLNAVCFNLGERGSSYTQLYDLTERKEGNPEIFLVNMLNIHWNMITFKSKEYYVYIMVNVDDKTKDVIFQQLMDLNRRGALPLV